MKLRPPVVATWLLKTLGTDPRNDQIMGDLIEELSRGRSRFWYWRQALAAIVSSFFDQIASHKLLALRAVLAGWLAWWILDRALTTGLMASINPWQERLPLLTGLIWWTAWLANRAFSGWVVARLHPAVRVAVVILFSLTVFLWKARIFQWPFYLDFEWPLRLIVNTHEEIRFLPGLLSVILAPLFVLLGGLSGTLPKRTAEQSSSPSVSGA